MVKVCGVCEKSFSTKDSRQRTCGSKVCADTSRSQTNKLRMVQGASAPAVLPLQLRQYIREDDLPPPEVLPASYLKRCADHWAEVTDIRVGEPSRRRIV